MVKDSTCEVDLVNDLLKGPLNAGTSAQFLLVRKKRCQIYPVQHNGLVEGLNAVAPFMTFMTSQRESYLFYSARDIQEMSHWNIFSFLHQSLLHLIILSLSWGSFKINLIIFKDSTLKNGLFLDHEMIQLASCLFKNSHQVCKSNLWSHFVLVLWHSGDLVLFKWFWDMNYCIFVNCDCLFLSFRSWHGLLNI